MPKRKKDEKRIQKYKKKLKRLQERYHQLENMDSESGSEKYPDIDMTPLERGEEQSDSDKENVEPQFESNNIIQTESNPDEPVLDLEILEALGDPIQKKPKYGLNINNDISKRCECILMNGLNKESKEILLQEYLIPENCKLLQAPKLNPEILATISDSIKNRDKKIESEQQQLGQGLTALNKALSMLVTNTSDKFTIIKTLSDASKILTDLHCCQTVSRKKLITPVLDKNFLEIIKEIDRDEYLYGENLSEKIKAMKYAQKSGQSIKKSDNLRVQINKKPGSSSGSGNFRGPPRFHTAKPYVRSGQKRPPQQERIPSYKQYHHPMKKSKTQLKPTAAHK